MSDDDPPATQADRWVGLLRELVNIDSGPDAVGGVHQVLDRLTPEFEALGFTTERRAMADAPDVLIATRPGRSGARRVLFLGHADTVFPAGTVAKRPFTIHDDGRATGPGVADMKAGLVVMLAALAALPTAALGGLHLTVMVNGDEESGSAGSRGAIEAEAEHAELALVFEPGRPPHTAVHARRGAQRYRIQVAGRAAHSGVEPDAGANAIEALAHHVLAVQDLGRRTSGGSVTAVIAGGGSRPNIVPDAAWLDVDARFDTAEVGAAIHAGVLALAETSPVAGTTTRVEMLEGRPAFANAGDDRSLQALFVGAADGLGIPLAFTDTGGSSDGNFAAAFGVPTLDGLGAVGVGYHTADESIELATLASRAVVTAGALERLASES